jgi:GDPmannose 4,6-dehydratase
VKINPAFYRPNEVPYLKGDSSKIKKATGWEAEIKFGDMIKEMVENDIS